MIVNTEDSNRLFVTHCFPSLSETISERRSQAATQTQHYSELTTRLLFRHSCDSKLSAARQCFRHARACLSVPNVRPYPFPTRPARYPTRHPGPECADAWLNTRARPR